VQKFNISILVGDLKTIFSWCRKKNFSIQLILQMRTLLWGHWRSKFCKVHKFLIVDVNPLS